MAWTPVNFQVVEESIYPEAHWGVEYWDREWEGGRYLFATQPAFLPPGTTWNEGRVRLYGQSDVRLRVTLTGIPGGATNIFNIFPPVTLPASEGATYYVSLRSGAISTKIPPTEPPPGEPIPGIPIGKSGLMWLAIGGGAIGLLGFIYALARRK